MAITVEVPEHNASVEFPDGTPPEEISAAMQKQFGGGQPAAPAKQAPTPQYRKQLADFIRNQGQRNFKQEAVRGLPMGNTIADATMGTYNNPVRPEQTVDALLGPAPSQSQSVGESMLRGIHSFAKNPGPQIEHLAMGLPNLARGVYDAATSPESGSLARFAKGTAKGLTAPLGGADVGSVLFGNQGVDTLNPFGEESFPQTKNAWEGDFLGSFLAAAAAPSLAKFAGKAAKVPVQYGAEGLSNILTDWVGNKPVQRVIRTLKGSTGLTVAEKQGIADTLLKHDIVREIPRGEGTNTLESKINERENMIGEVVNQYAGQDTGVPVQPVINKLNEMRSKAQDSTEWESRTALIDKAIDKIKNNPKVRNGILPIEVAQSMKIDLGERASWGEYTDFENAIRKAQHIGLRDGIGEAAPEILPINKELGPMYEALGPLSKAESRMSNLETGASLKQTSHGNLGLPGKIYGAIKGVTESNKISPLIAQGMYNLKRELNPTQQAPLTLPDFVPLPAKGPMHYDPSTGLWVRSEVQSSGGPRIPTNLAIGPKRMLDPSTGQMISVIQSSGGPTVKNGGNIQPKSDPLGIRLTNH